MTSPGDDYGRPPDLGDQVGAETRRMGDFLRGGRGGGSGRWNRTSGGCGSQILIALLVGCALAISLIYLF
jgi:hypothetical protein